MTETTPPSSDPPAPATAGQWLREARTRQGLHLAMLSAALKVPVRTLEHLEADRHQDLPGATFVRALTLSVCRQLRLEPGPVLALLPQREAHVDALPPSLHSPMPALRRARTLRLERSHWIAAGSVTLLLSVTAALWWWPGPPSQTPSEPVSSVVSTPQVLPSAESVQPSVAAPQAGPALAQASGLASTPAPAASSFVASVAVTGASAIPTLRLQASGECWVEVRDANNQVVLNAVMQAGQQQDVVQPAPLKVVLGHAALMKVQVRGQLFDLAPHTKITVARFEVQP